MSDQPQRPSQSYRDSIARQKAMLLARSIYRLIPELRKMLNALRRSISNDS